MFSFVLGQVLKIVIFLLSGSTESWKCWVWRKSLVISSPASVPKAGSPGASCKGPCAVIFLSSSKDGDFTISLRNVLHCSVTFTPKTSVFLTFLWNSLLFSSCPLTLGLSLGTTDKSLALSSLHPAPSGIYPCWWGPPESSLLQEQSQLSQPLLEHMADFPSPLIISVGCVITSGAVWSWGTVDPDRDIWRPIPAHPCQMRSLEFVPGWCDLAALLSVL